MEIIELILQFFSGGDSRSEFLDIIYELMKSYREHRRPALAKFSRRGAILLEDLENIVNKERTTKDRVKKLIKTARIAKKLMMQRDELITKNNELVNDLFDLRNKVDEIIKKS